MSTQIYGIVIVKQTTSHFCVDVAFQKLFRLDLDKVIGLIQDGICRDSPLYTVGCCATLVGFRLECWRFLLMYYGTCATGHLYKATISLLWPLPVVLNDSFTFSTTCIVRPPV